jgi:hypothetical protein
MQRITLLSFRTFGDYVLKAPFLFELARLYPGAEVTMITNRKGGQVYPLIDSRLKLVVVDHGDPKVPMLRKLFAVPRADLVIALDDSRTTLLLSLILRGKRKTGWVQGISLLYAEGGFFEWKSVRPWVSTLVKAEYRPGRIRLPEDKHDAEVELELLDLQGRAEPLPHVRRHLTSIARRKPGGVHDSLATNNGRASFAACCRPFRNIRSLSMVQAG